MSGSSSSSSSSAQTLGSRNRIGTVAATNNGIVGSAHSSSNINNSNREGVMRPQDALAQTGEYSNRDSHAPYGGSSTYLHTTATPPSGAAAQGETPPARKDVAGDSAPLTPAVKVKRTDTIQDVAGENAKVNDSSEVYPVVRPIRLKSVMQRKAQYKPVTGQFADESSPISVCSTSNESSPALNSERDAPTRKKGSGRIAEIVDAVQHQTHGDTAKSVRIVDNGSSLHMYNFTIGEPKKENNSAGDRSNFSIQGSMRSQRLTSATSRSSTSSRDSQTDTVDTKCSSPHARQKTAVGGASIEPVGSTLKNTPLNFSGMLHSEQSVVSQQVGRKDFDDRSSEFGKKVKVTFAGVPSSEDGVDEDGGGKEDEPYFARPTAQTHHCNPRENLYDDTVSFRTYWETFQSPTLHGAIIFALRTALCAVMPAFVLMTHPNTKDWFKAGALMPIVAALFSKQVLGVQMKQAILGWQGAAFFITWGVVMNSVGAKFNSAGWWCAVLFGPLVVGLFGQLPSKRFMMMYIVIIMQTEHMPGGTALTFPCYFGRDIIFGSLFALFGSCFPFPTFATTRAEDCLLGIAKLLGLSTANITKSFWAPVNIDAKASLSQVPFAKIDSLIAACREMISMAAYEPFEGSLNNQLRTERVEGIRRIMILLHCAYGGAQKRIEDLEKRRFNPHAHIAHQMQERMQPHSEDLSMEIMKSLLKVGKLIKPEEVARVDMSELDEKARIVSDLVVAFRRDLLYYQGATSGEVNMVLNTCIFHETLVDIAREITKLKESMTNFDPTKYKSTWQRAKEIFFLDYWNSFWDELPRRLTLATPYDVRIWKDSVKFSLAFTVACAFTLRVDPGNVYFFGMAILIRLAQQTASETLQIGIMRIFGLCIGASLSYITKHHTHRYVEEVLLTMTFVFVALCFTSNPTLVNGAQYTLVVAIAGLSLAGDPALLMTRVSDNVFAFISYFLICTFVFPFDPIRIFWNTRTRLLFNVNEITQQCVALACAPVTRDKNEIKTTLEKTQKLLMSQHALLTEYGDWMSKSETEPLLRGGDYPTEACRALLRCLSYITSLQELMFYSIQMIHRNREGNSLNQISLVFIDAMDMYHPFMEDMGRIVYAIIQDLIDSTEISTTWSVEGLLHSLWKANCAIDGLHHLMGNIQKNYIAALMELSPEEKQNINPYFSASFVDDRLTMAAANAALAGNPNEGNITSTAEGPSDASRLMPDTTFALYGISDSSLNKVDSWDESRYLSKVAPVPQNALWSVEDTRGFGSLVTASELFLKSMSSLFQPMIRIHEFEKSRHPEPGG